MKKKHVNLTLDDGREVKVSRRMYKKIVRKASKLAYKNYFKKHPKTIDQMKKVMKECFIFAEVGYLLVKETNGEEAAEKYEKKILKKMKFKMPLIAFSSYLLVVISFVFLSGIFLYLIEWIQPFTSKLSEMGQGFVSNIILILYGASVVAFNKKNIFIIYELHKYIPKLVEEFKYHNGLAKDEK